MVTNIFFFSTVSEDVYHLELHVINKLRVTWILHTIGRFGVTWSFYRSAELKISSAELRPHYDPVSMPYIIMCCAGAVFHDCHGTTGPRCDTSDFGLWLDCVSWPWAMSKGVRLIFDRGLCFMLQLLSAFSAAWVQCCVAFLSGFFQILSSGLWSACTVNSFSNRFVWNLVIPNTSASVSLGWNDSLGHQTDSWIQMLLVDYPVWDMLPGMDASTSNTVCFCESYYFKHA